MLKLAFSIFFIIMPFSIMAADVIFLEKDKKRGEIITDDDVSVGAINSKTSRGYVSHIESDKMYAKRDLEGGKPLKKTDVYIDNAVIHKDEMITVRLIKKNLVIEVKGIALSNGIVGDNIKVRTVDTNKILVGKVAQDGSVALSN